MPCARRSAPQERACRVPPACCSPRRSPNLSAWWRTTRRTRAEPSAWVFCCARHGSCSRAAAARKRHCGNCGTARRGRAGWSAPPSAAGPR
ncbi:hypothetical protein AN219_02250, partial [Streptomyces nanshensis]